MLYNINRLTHIKIIKDRFFKDVFDRKKPQKLFIIKKMMNFFFKFGKKIKFFKVLNNFLFLFYLILKNKNRFSTLNYLFLNEFLFSLRINSNFFNINYVFLWVESWLKPIFILECNVVPKKYRKKHSNKYIYKVRYLNKKKRKNKMFKLISNYFNTITDLTFKRKYQNLIFNLIFNYKKSILYKNKINVYKFFFKI